MQVERRNGFRTLTAAKRLAEKMPCSKEPMVYHQLEVCLNVDVSLKGWTDNCLYRCKRTNLQDKMNLLSNSVYCEVLGNRTCNKCMKVTKTLSSVNSSLAAYPDLNTGGYLLFLTMNEKLQKNTSPTLPLSSSVQQDSGYSSQLVRRSSPSIDEKPHSRCRVRSASVLASELHRLPNAITETSPRASSTRWRPSTSKTTSSDTSNPSGQRVSSSRMSMRTTYTPRRNISVLSQEGWSVKQIEAWKLLAPTPPQIEVSEMNVSMYTPKELPGIKIFDESFFVI